MQRNVELFNYSLTKPEAFLEATYKKGELVITPSSSEKNELMQRNAKLNDLITTYKTMQDEMTGEQKDRLVGKVVDLLFNTREKMNYTAFSQYFMVCDLSYSVLQQEDQATKMKIIKEVLREYIADRHGIYSSHGYSDIVLQVMSDNYSHKRNCSTGVDKIVKRLVKAGLYECQSDQNLDGDFFLLPDKDGSGFNRILSRKGIKFEWKRSKQGKDPDVYIQRNGIVYIIEHKHMKEGGGGQNKQDTEITDFIKYSERGVSYITYLDGPYFNRLISPSERSKESVLKKDIVSHLMENPNNYFVNTAGFERLLVEVII